MSYHHPTLFAVCAVVFGFSLAAAAVAAEPAKPGPAERLWVYIGTYTVNTASKGIYLAQLDVASGRLELLGAVAETKNPSFVAIHPNRRFLYAVGELASDDGKKSGALMAYAIDPANGKLTLLGQQASQGVGPCHVNVDRTGQCALAANYASGSIACLPIAADGKLGAATAAIQHQGSSVNPRQQGPHAHSVNFDPSGRFVFACDLGLDKVLIYRLDAAAGRLTPNDPAAASTAPGAGPRHFAFHPNGRFAYVIDEIDSTITAFRFDAARGALETIASISTLPAGFQGENTTAEVQVHPSGKFVYGSNRGHNSIAIFAVDEETGKLRALGHESTGGKTPRNFGIDPSGTWLLAANQATGNIVVFRIDAQTGALRPTGQSLDVPAPVCVKFMVPPGR